MLLTSKDQATDRIWGLRQGAREYLTKPISGADLLARITALENSESLST
jgi:twitching motility two-component system response regulator PilH